MSGIFSAVTVDYLMSLLPHFKSFTDLEELCSAIAAANSIGFRCRIQQDVRTIEFQPQSMRLDSLASAVPLCALHMLEAAVAVPRTKEELSMDVLDVAPAKTARYTEEAASEELSRMTSRRARIQDIRSERQKQREARDEERKKSHEDEEARRKATEESQQKKEAEDRERKREEEARVAAQEEQNKLLLSEAAAQYGLSDKLKGLEKKVKHGEIKDVTDVTTRIQEALVEKHFEQDRRRQEERARVDHLIREQREEEKPLLRQWIQARTSLTEEQKKERLAAHRQQWEADVAKKHELAPYVDLIDENL